MGLTVTEKEFFRKKLLAKCKELVKAINSRDPVWGRKVHQQAHESLMELFGTEELLKRLEAARAKLHKHEEAVRVIAAELAEQVTGRDAATAPVPNCGTYEVKGAFSKYPQHLRVALCSHYEFFVAELQKANPVGLAIHQLNVAQSNFDDNLMMCSTHKQLETVWAEVLEELGEISKPVDRQLRKVTVRKDPKE